MHRITRYTLLFALGAAIASAVPRLVSIEPDLAKPGDEVTTQGQDVGQSTVVKLFLTAGGKDIEVEMKEQTDDSIRFQVPADIELGAYNLMIQTGGAAPALMEQPVVCTVESAEGIEKRRKEEEELLKAPPEPAPAEGEPGNQ